MKEKLVSTEIPIQGMTCAMCANAITDVLSDSDGVAKASVNLGSETASVEFDLTFKDNEIERRLASKISVGPNEN